MGDRSVPVGKFKDKLRERVEGERERESWLLLKNDALWLSAAFGRQPGSLRSLNSDRVVYGVASVNPGAEETEMDYRAPRRSLLCLSLLDAWLEDGSGRREVAQSTATRLAITAIPCWCAANFSPARNRRPVGRVTAVEQTYLSVFMFCVSIYEIYLFHGALAIRKTVNRPIDLWDFVEREDLLFQLHIESSDAIGFDSIYYPPVKI